MNKFHINIVNKVLFIATDNLFMILLSLTVILLIVSIIFLVKKFRSKTFNFKNQNTELRELYENSSKREKELSDEILNEKQKSTSIIAKINREINNSVNGIMGMANLLRDTRLTAEQEKNASAIIECSETLLQNTKVIFNNNPHNNAEMDNIKSIKGLLNKPNSNSTSKPVTPDFAKDFPLKILVAEDDTINQHLAIRILNKLGYNPDVVSNGKEALEAVSEKNYDVILMDGLMPQMDGFEATRMIRLCLEVQPVIIALTASTMYGDKEKCLQAGMNDYISKPLIINELASTLEKWSTEKRAAS